MTSVRESTTRQLLTVSEHKSDVYAVLMADAGLTLEDIGEVIRGVRDADGCGNVTAYLAGMVVGLGLAQVSGILVVEVPQDTPTPPRRGHRPGRRSRHG